MIAVEVFGTQVLAARFRDEIRAFKREQRKQIRKAANVIKKDAIQEAQNLFASRGPHKGPHGKMLGPLDRNIGIRVFDTVANVMALIRPKAMAFYGRFLERGLDVMRRSPTKNAMSIRKRRLVHGASPFHLPRTPFLEPVAEADADKVADLMGESYGTFYSGG